MRRYPGFVGPSYTSQSKIAAADRCVNLYPEKVESGTGQAPYVLYPAPGFTPYCVLPTSPVRGLYTINGASLAIAGDALYELPYTAGGTAILRASGLYNPDDSAATMVGSGDGSRQLVITSGSRVYVFDLITDTLTEIAGLSATVCGFMDGYFLALDANRSELRFSDLEDGSVWSAADVAQRNDSGDKWIAMLVRQKDLWLFGSQTSSVYYNSGDADTPWVPNPSVFASQGIGAPRSAALLRGMPIWLGHGAAGGRIIYRANGYTPERISTHALEYALSTYASVTDAVAFTYEDQGHEFYVLTFPSEGATWVFDATTGLWHERGEWDGATFTGYPVDGHIYVNDVHLVGSTTDGTIYRMGIDLATAITGDPGTGLRRLRVAPHLVADGNTVVYSRLRLKLETGLGLPAISGNPETAPDAAFAAGAGITSGVHAWAHTFVTLAGESLPSPSSDPLDIGSTIATPTAQIVGSYTSTGTGGPYPFATGDAERLWAVTFITDAGETLPSPLMSASVAHGPLPAGGPFYADISAIPIGGAGVTGRRVYRTAAGLLQLKLVATLDNVVTTYADHTTDLLLGANVPVANTAVVGNRAALTNIARGPAGTIARKVYRTAAAGSQLKLVTTIADNTTETYTDSTADGSLGANVPTNNTAALEANNGAAATVMLRWSNDGGQTWSATRTASAGAIGEYDTDVSFRRMGAGRDRVFEISMSDAIPWRVIDAFLDTRGGS